MGRWEPNARGRLEQAAMDLYIERGFEQTTVAEIAKRAGLTERTFFRHFADKREVLFGSSTALKDDLLEAVAATPAAAPPIDAVAAALHAAATHLQDRHEFAHRRQAVIAANPDLQERELIKLAALSDALAEALRHRGVPDPTAALAAEAGVAVFKIAFTHWINDPAHPHFPDVIKESLTHLKAVTAGT